jgi:signal transduction histidine kinase
MRHTGIDVIGSAPWGTHLCQFYQNKQDLIDILVPYFRQGLADDEFCMWITSEPLVVDEAKAALRSVVPALDEYIRKGQIEILDYTQWYVRNGRFHADEVLRGWVEKLENALERGYKGLRLTGNTFWLEDKDWADFTAYEEAINRVIGKYRMLAICTYSLAKCGAYEVMDVISNHRFALVKRAGRWQMIESSEHQETEAALRESEARRKVAEAVEAERQRLFDVLETLPTMVCLLTPDYHVAFANRSFREQFGESHGRRCYEYCYGRAEPCEFCQSYTVLETGQAHHWEVTALDGTIVDVHDFPFTDVDGSPMILEMDIDITEQRHAQEALIQTERLTAIGRMAASLAHEINNPIQSVVGCLGLAIETLAEGEDATRFLDVAMEESERAARIVYRMRDLGRSEDGHKEPAAVGELLEKVLILTGHQAHNQRVEVSWEGEDSLPPVPMVRDRIQQVFLNLVLNALEAMPEGGELHVRAGRTEEPAGVGVSFADTGAGIVPEEVARLFEAFHSTKQLGLGLGLYVSRNILQEHGGWIDVQSQVGQGATFTIWLPADGA